MKPLRAILIVAASALVSACITDSFLREIDRARDRLDPPAVEQPADPTPPAKPPAKPPTTAAPNPANPAAYRSGFVWKPVSEHGKLVVLLPSAFTQHTGRRMELRHNGAVIESSNRAHNSLPMPNGNREHYRFAKPGSGYPAPLEAVVRVGDRDWVWAIPSPGTRYDGNVTPQVRP